MNEPKYRKITINIEDGNTVTHIEKDNEEFLKQYYQLQSNWNSLREWLERKIELNKEGRTTVSGMTFKGVNEAMYKQFLDKMNELEGKDNNE